MLKKYKIQSEANGLIDITHLAEQALAEEKIESGLMVISIPHSTASVSLVSPWDPKGLEDVDDELSRLIPARIDFKHQHDTPQDAAGHVRAAIVGHSRVLYIDEGKLGVGHSQKIYFWEFDGPRSRNVEIKLIRG